MKIELFVDDDKYKNFIKENCIKNYSDIVKYFSIEFGNEIYKSLLNDLALEKSAYTIFLETYIEEFAKSFKEKIKPSTYDYHDEIDYFEDYYEVYLIRDNLTTGIAYFGLVNQKTRKYLIFEMHFVFCSGNKDKLVIEPIHYQRYNYVSYLHFGENFKVFGSALNVFNKIIEHSEVKIFPGNVSAFENICSKLILR